MAQYEDDDAVDTATAVVPDDNLDVELGDEKVMASTGLEKVLPEKGKVARVNLLTDLVTPKMAWTHFITDKGSFRCLSKRDDKGNILGTPAICCKKTAKNDKEQAQLTVAVLAFQYTNANGKDGKYPKEDPPAIEWELRWLKLSRSGFKKVSELPEEDQKHHEIDIMISWRTNKIGFDYNKIASKARFRQNPALFEEVKLAAAPYLDGKQLISRLGRKLSETELAALFAGQAATSATEAVVDDVADL